MKLKIIVTLILCVTSLSIVFAAAEHPRSVRIKGTFTGVPDGDSVHITVYPAGMQELAKKYVAYVKNGRCEIRIPDVGTALYANFFPPRRYSYSSQKYLLSAGDELFITEAGNNQLLYEVKGSVKFACLDSLTAIQREMYRRKWKPSDAAKVRPSRENFEYLDSITDTQLDFLRSRKQMISPQMYTLVTIDLLSDNQLAKSSMFDSYKAFPDSPRNKDLSKQVIGYKDQKWLQLCKLVKENSALSQLSLNLYTAVSKKYVFDSCIQQKTAFDLASYISFVTKNYHGALREKLWSQALLRYKNRQSDIGSIISGVLPQMKVEILKNELSKVMTGIASGAKAYDFSLMNVKGKQVRLSDFKGKVVLMDFWYTGCPNCIPMNTALKKVEDSLKAVSDIVFVSINCDRNRQQWITSIGGGLYTNEDRINLFTNGQAMLNAAITNYMVNGYPTLIIVDKKGYFAAKTGDPRQDNGRELIGVLKSESAK
jgi:cytochrome oxidase Cu insertion factor (SCO1/SenC/PrrC family)